VIELKVITEVAIRTRKCCICGGKDRASGILPGEEHISFVGQSGYQGRKVVGHTHLFCLLGYVEQSIKMMKERR
jgi:hypothetical protein